MGRGRSRIGSAIADPCVYFTDTVRCGVMTNVDARWGPYDRCELFRDGSGSFGLRFVYYGLVRAAVQRRDFRAGLGALWSAAGFGAFRGSLRSGRTRRPSLRAGQCSQSRQQRGVTYEGMIVHIYMHVR